MTNGPGRKPVQLDLRCNGCGQRVGYTSRPQPVPVRCLDPFCSLTRDRRVNEERDSFIEHLHVVEGKTAEEISQVVDLSRQGVHRVLTSA